VKIMLTGATGLIGSHTLAAALAAGHEVTALVRTPERLDRALELHGLDPADPRVEVVVGDVTDPAAVRSALEGADAAVHSAAMVSMRRADATTMTTTNTAGTRHVLMTATELGLDPVVHISSVSAVFPPNGPVLRSTDEVSEPSSAYGRTKAASERLARELQTQDHPVVVFYPGGVIGPPDPSGGEMTSALVDLFARGSFVVPNKGGNLFIDSRDLAGAILAALEPERGPRRFMAGGQFVTWSDWLAVLSEVSGRTFRTPSLPAGVLKGIGRTSETVARLLRFDPPYTYEMAYYMTEAVPSDDSALHEDLGVRYRPVTETTADLVRWLVATGRVPADQVPALAD
jgi:nucleoside-diphosphate-sugar epimerase